MTQTQKIFSPILCLGLIFTALSAHGYNSALETGELLKEGEYKATFETQLLTDDEVDNSNTGVNFIGRFDTWLSEELNFQGLVGFGEVDTQIGGFVKWIPFPDFDQQPAIGFKLGAQYARLANENELSLRFIPFVSKAFETDLGVFTPFISAPLGIRTIKGDSDLPMQLALGTEWKAPDYEKLRFLFEAGFNVNDAFGYLSFGVSLAMDDTNGIVIE